MSKSKAPKRAPERIHAPEPLILPPQGYQPSKAEQEAEIDMPGMSVKQIRQAFFRPFRFVRD